MDVRARSARPGRQGSPGRPLLRLGPTRAGRPRGLGLVVRARVRVLGAGARPWHNGLGVSGWRSYWTCCGR